MKRTFISLIALFSFSFIASAQDSQSMDKETKAVRNCGTTEYMEQQKLQNPDLENQMLELETWTQEWIQNNPDYSPKTVVTVPVVVHVLYSTTSQNITDARVQEQIAILNTDYAGSNTHSMGSFAPGLKSNTELQFCLAKRTPSGAVSTGIERKQTTVSQFTYDDKMKHASSGGLDQWDPKKYMNIWVCNLGGGLCGYAQFPAATLNNNFGVVIHYQYFGKTGASAPYNLGGTTTHEIGHCFNLYHIWGDDGGSCSGTDYCTDTPNQASENYGHLTGVQTDACSSASPGIMYMNFMDYSDDISYANFTPNQKARIQSLFANGGNLDDLKVSNGCVLGSGIQEIENIRNIIVYPNPSSGTFNLEFDLNDNQDVEITVTDVLGNSVFSALKSDVYFINMPIDLSDKANGMYYINIKTKTQSLTQKLAKYN